MASITQINFRRAGSPKLHTALGVKMEALRRQDTQAYLCVGRIALLALGSLLFIYLHQLFSNLLEISLQQRVKSADPPL